MNRILNPVVGLILKSPLHGIMSSALLLLIYRGRKSGKKYQLPVQYVQEGETIYIVPGTPQRKVWWRNFEESAPVRVVLRGRERSGKASLLTGEKAEAEIAKALKLYFKRFPSAARMHNVSVHDNGTYEAESLDRAARETIIVQVNLQPTD